MIRRPPTSAGGANLGVKPAHGSAKMPELIINDGETVMDKIAIFCEMSSDLYAAFLLTLRSMVINLLRPLLEFLQVISTNFFMVFRQQPDIACSKPYWQPRQDLLDSSYGLSAIRPQ